MILDDKLNTGETLLLDGAVGAEVERFGGKMDSAAWCGLATANRQHFAGRAMENET